jgi:hypothetical protein
MKSDFAIRRRQLQQETRGDFRPQSRRLDIGLPGRNPTEDPSTGSEDLTMTSTLRAFILGVILAVTTNSVTQAADRSITLNLGAGSTLEVERPFKTIIPDIVDVHARSDRSVILEPLNPGATNLVFLDDRSIAITNVRILVCSTGATPVKYEDGPDCE